VVNFINILLLTFSPIIWRQKIARRDEIREKLLNSLSFEKGAIIICFACFFGKLGVMLGLA